MNDDIQPQPSIRPDVPASEDEEVIALANSMLDAARRGDGDGLLPLIDRGAPANLRDASGNSALMLAAYHGHAELVRELAARGADVDLLNDRRQSPLAGAAFKGYTDVAVALLEAGADPGLGSPDALETARFFERGEIITLIEEHAARRED
ncbi:ankyrin repeat domain-containing protein [Brachybacterium sp. GCM10030267]|uniref:ankyrin repeat domain-containing protein n=1 Tax=Brachybacterium sp. GCM10030267 TaxID=3273381 RepID=UPI0036126F09